MIMVKFIDQNLPDFHWESQMVENQSIQLKPIKWLETNQMVENQSNG